MVNFMRATKRLSPRIIAILLAALAMLAQARPAEAATGVVHLRLAKAGLLVGVGRVTGSLHFQGRTYRLHISAISAGTIGVGVTRLKGHAYHLRSAADIVGHYTVASASVAIAAGKKVVRLQKSKGNVYLQLEGSQIGLELTASLGGVSIALH